MKEIQRPFAIVDCIIQIYIGEFICQPLVEQQAPDTRIVENVDFAVETVHFSADGGLAHEISVPPRVVDVDIRKICDLHAVFAADHHHAV